MGLFAALSGVPDAPASEVSQAISNYVATPRMNEQLKKKDRGVIHDAQNNVTVLYPAAFTNWDDLSQYLSEAMDRPVFSFHIHDGDLWMFVLFYQGEKVTQFNTVPDYWEELTAEQLTEWRGDPERISSLLPRVSREAVEKYLVFWSDDNEGEFAYPDDQSPIGDPWQLADFMKRFQFS